MRRPGSNECLQDKPRNRHFAEWRFLPLIRTVTVNPKIWNVIVIGINIPPFGGGQTARLRREPWGSIRTAFILSDQSKNVNSSPFPCA